MPKKSVSNEDTVSATTKPDVSVEDFVGEPVPASLEPTEPRSLTVDERVIPDAGLPTEFVEGVLDISNEGSGLLRPKFAASDKDIYISSSQIRRFNLRVGDKVGGQARSPKASERYWGILKVEMVNGKPVNENMKRVDMDDLVAIYPDMRI